MNCVDCRDYFTDRTEHLLDPDTAIEYECHLALCADCREHVAATEALCHRLTAHAATGVAVSLALPVMRRIQERRAPDRAVTPIARISRWWIGAGAAAAAALALLITGLMLSPRDSRAQAVDVMTRGITTTARLATVHLQGRMRTAPADNFSYINPKAEFSPIELWKELDGQKRWRIEKPGRVAVMDGQSTVLYLRPNNSGRKAAVAAPAAFDTGWLQSVADIEQTLVNGLAMAQTHGWKIDLTEATDAAGVVHQLVTIDVPAAVAPNDYLRNKFLQTAETRRLYRFNAQSGQLEALQIYVHEGSDYLLVFEVTQIDYNQPLTTDTFTLDLPTDVSWTDLPPPDAQPTTSSDPKYAAMTPEQAARAIFEAFARRDWEEVQNFWPMPLNDRTKAALGGITVVSIGESFTSVASSAQYVPYEIRLSDGATKKHNLALKKNPRTGVWRVDGGI
jgi:hypothetical protein